MPRTDYQGESKVPLTSQIHVIEIDDSMTTDAPGFNNHGCIDNLPVAHTYADSQPAKNFSKTGILLSIQLDTDKQTIEKLKLCTKTKIKVKLNEFAILYNIKKRHISQFSYIHV